MRLAGNGNGHWKNRAKKFRNLGNQIYKHVKNSQHLEKICVEPHIPNICKRSTEKNIKGILTSSQKYPGQMELPIFIISTLLQH
jgi:hypothetical protein